MVNPGLLKIMGNTFLGKMLLGFESSSAVDKRIALKLKNMLGREVNIESMKRESLTNIRVLDKYMLQVQANKEQLKAATKIEGQEVKYAKNYEKLVKEQTEVYYKLIDSLKLLCTHEFFKMVYDVKKPLDVYENYFTRISTVMSDFVKNGGIFEEKTEEELLKLIDEVKGSYKKIIDHVENLIHKDHEIYKNLAIINGTINEEFTLSDYITQRTKITRSISLEMARIVKKMNKLESALSKDVKSESGQALLLNINEFKKTIMNMLQLSFKRIVLSNQIIIYVKRLEVDIWSDLRNLEKEIHVLKEEIIEEVKTEDKIIKKAQEQKVDKNVVQSFIKKEKPVKNIVEDLDKFEKVVKEEEIGVMNAAGTIMDKEISIAEKKVVEISQESDSSLNQAKRILEEAEKTSMTLSSGKSRIAKIVLAMIISIMTIFQSPAKAVVQSFTAPESLKIDLASYVRDSEDNIMIIDKDTKTDDLKVLGNTVELLNGEGELVTIGPSDVIDKTEYQVKEIIERTQNEIKTTSVAEAKDISQTSWNTLTENWVFIKQTKTEVDTSIIVDIPVEFFLSPDFKKLDQKKDFVVVENMIDSSMKKATLKICDEKSAELTQSLRKDFTLLTDKQISELSQKGSKKIILEAKKIDITGKASPEGKLGETPTRNNFTLSGDRAKAIKKEVLPFLQEKNGKSFQMNSEQGLGNYNMEMIFDSLENRTDSRGDGIIIQDPRIEEVIAELNKILVEGNIPSFINGKILSQKNTGIIEYSKLGQDKTLRYFDEVMKSLKQYNLKKYEELSKQLPRYVRVKIDLKMKMEFGYKVVHKILRVIPQEGIPVFFDWRTISPVKRLKWDDVKYKPLRGHKQPFRKNHPRQEAGHVPSLNFRKNPTKHYVNKGKGI